MTRKRTDVDALHAVFERVGRIPAYLTLVVGHMARARTNDPWRGYALWREAEGLVRLDALWAGLRPLDRCILQHAAHGRHRIYGAGFAALATEAVGESISPQKIQTAVRRLLRQELLALEESGDLGLPDRSLQLYLVDAEHGRTGTAV